MIFLRDQVVVKCVAHDSMSFVSILLFVVLSFFLGTLKQLTYAHAVCGRPTLKDAVERLFWPGLVRKLKESLYVENKCVLNRQICENDDMNCTETKCERREAQNCESFLKKKVPALKVSASGIESQRCTPSRMHLVKFLKKVNFLSICIIMAFCFLLLLNPFVFGAVTLFHLQLLVSFAMILTSAVVSIFYHTWCSVLCLNEAIMNACNDCGQFEKDSSVSVVVNVENKESIKDGQLQSCCAKLVYCEGLKGCRHVALRDGEVSSVSAKQLKGALQENIFENEAQPCVIVDIDNKESVDDLQFRSRYAKFVYCKSVRRRHQRD